jgi:hypothetical protein
MGRFEKMNPFTAKQFAEKLDSAAAGAEALIDKD